MRIVYVWWNAVECTYDSDWHSSHESAMQWPAGAGYRVAALSELQVKEIFS